MFQNVPTAMIVKLDVRNVETERLVSQSTQSSTKSK